MRIRSSFITVAERAYKGGDCWLTFQFIPEVQRTRLVEAHGAFVSFPISHSSPAFNHQTDRKLYHTMLYKKAGCVEFLLHRIQGRLCCQAEKCFSFVQATPFKCYHCTNVVRQNKLLFKLILSLSGSPWEQKNGPELKSLKIRYNELLHFSPEENFLCLFVISPCAYFPVDDLFSTVLKLFYVFFARFPSTRRQFCTLEDTTSFFM